MMSLRGEPILVTGAGRGLGLAISRRLAAEGARVWLADVRTDWLSAAVEDLRGDGLDVAAVPVDVTDVESVAEMVRTTGPLYGLVNNAARADGVGGAHRQHTPDVELALVGQNLVHAYHAEGSQPPIHEIPRSWYAGIRWKF